MREMRFSIKHEGCWGSIASEKFPGVVTKLVSSIDIDKKTPTKTVWSCLHSFESNDREELSAFMDFLKGMGVNEKIDVLYHSNNYALVYVVSSAQGSIAERVYANHCYVMGDLTIANGWEKWHVIAKTPEDLKHLINDLQPLGEVVINKIGSLKPPARESRLTKKQENALRLSLEKEYYSWSRKVTLEELSAMVGISRRAFADHLRKAESKFFPPLIRERL